jgi:hypothetical protein
MTGKKYNEKIFISFVQELITHMYIDVQLCHVLIIKFLVILKHDVLYMSIVSASVCFTG